VGFRYLWLNLPVVALAAAVAATVGLVLLVRAIRGSDDPQTTILAVLVGLVVTISPAVLLLAVR
jgi:formate-dependent nitrite reductase membrane component NrfD